MEAQLSQLLSVVSYSLGCRAQTANQWNMLLEQHPETVSTGMNKDMQQKEAVHGT